jgi:hypothetical protein
MNAGEKVYLGDSVYALFDGYHIVLTTNNGLEDTNTIYLDPSVQVDLVKFIEWIVEAA